MDDIFKLGIEEQRIGNLLRYLWYNHIRMDNDTEELR